MKDEYGNMDASGETYVADQFTTEHGCVRVSLLACVSVRVGGVSTRCVRACTQAACTRVSQPAINQSPPYLPQHFMHPPRTRSVTMRQVEVRYNTFGQLNAAKDNVLVVCHALTGNARLDTWWSSMLGPGQAFDTDK